MERAALIFPIVFILLTLAGCGIKPGTMEPPTPAGKAFPHTYPDITHDPAPGR
jgi:hypothetical protein